MTVKTVYSSRTAHKRAVREGFQESAVIPSSVILIKLVHILFRVVIIVQRYKIKWPFASFLGKKCEYQKIRHAYCKIRHAYWIIIHAYFALKATGYVT